MDEGESSSTIESDETSEVSESPEVDVVSSEGYDIDESYEDCETGGEYSDGFADRTAEDAEYYDDCGLENAEVDDTIDVIDDDDFEDLEISNSAKDVAETSQKGFENYEDCSIDDVGGQKISGSDDSGDLNGERTFIDFEKIEKTFETEPHDENGNLKANIEYTAGEYDYHYTTDEQGRIDSFRADKLQLTERDDRLHHNGKTFDKGETDDAGHLIGDRFGGSPHLDNLVSQDSHINRSEYKVMENEWANAIQDGHKVEIFGEVNYEDDTKRPSSFDVYYSIDGEVYEKSFINRKD